MGVPNLFNKFRHFSTSRRLFSIVATVSLSSDAIAFDSDQFRPLKPNPSLRSFSASSRHGVKGLGARRTMFSDIIETIRRNESDFESRLNRANVCLSVASVAEILQALSVQNLPALRFFNWIRNSIPTLSRNHEICSLLIDNLGRLNDNESMTRELIQFTREQICLTRNAFRFLPESSTNDVSSLTNSVAGIVNVLNGVGGSCRSSGVRSLIELFATSGLPEMAKFVIRITEATASHYNILIREACRRCDAEAARALLHEMRLQGCDPNVASHNLVLSLLCKSAESVEELVKEMEAMDWPPDEITFEIVIARSCRLRRFDFALELMERMAGLGLKPRLNTHAVLVKAYFEVKRYEEARKYVADLSSNVVFCLLAELHLKRRNVGGAMEIMLEMIEKGLRPNFRAYSRLLESLWRLGRIDLAGDLERKYSSLCQQYTPKKSG